jgi:hypothetical protein
MDKETVPLSRKWLNSVFWLFLGLALGLVAGCTTLSLDAAQSSEDVSICLITPYGDQCYKIKDLPSEIEDIEALE